MRNNIVRCPDCRAECYIYSTDEGTNSFIPINKAGQNELPCSVCGSRLYMLEDTSMNISDEELSKFLEEIKGMGG